MTFSFNFIRESEVALKKKKKKTTNKKKREEEAQPREQNETNSISQHKHSHLQMMNKRRDYERQSSSMPSSNGSRNPEVRLIVAAVCVCYLQKGEFTCRQPRSVICFAAGMCFRAGQVGLLADGLQGIEGAFDVTDLCSQGVYGLHGTIQLLAASHQCVHTLYTHVHRLSQAVH